MGKRLDGEPSTLVQRTQRMCDICRNPSLGLATKVRGCKVAGQEGDPGVTSHAPRSVKSVRVHALTLPRELPCWELESQKDF